MSIRILIHSTSKCPVKNLKFAWITSILVTFIGDDMCW